MAFDDYAEEWFRGLVVRPKTLAGYRSLLDPRILPTFEDIELRRITPDLLRSWIAEMADEELSGSRMAQAKRVVSAVLAQAVTDERRKRQPAAPTDSRPRVGHHGQR